MSPIINNEQPQDLVVQILISIRRVKQKRYKFGLFGEAMLNGNLYKILMRAGKSAILVSIRIT